MGQTDTAIETTSIEPTTCKHLWTDSKGGLRSTRFDDFYYYPQSGAEETQHVFIEGNQLLHRWQAWAESIVQNNNNHDSQSFNIFETGFGTGLNFICCVNQWIKIFKDIPKEKQPTLHYFSAEKFPFTQPALEKAFAVYNPLPELSQILLDLYPDPIARNYFIDFYTDSLCKIKLHLFFEDSLKSLDFLEHYPFSPKNDIKMDAWFMDGFAPSENPNMWSKELFKKISRHSKTKTTLATFTSARTVKDALTLNNFNYVKQKGFGNKRDMLSATYLPEEAASTINTNTKQPDKGDHRLCYFYRDHHHKNSRLNSNNNSVLVIGSGIAGSFVAHSLAQKNWKVTVVDKNSIVSNEASGNLAGIIYARTAAKPSSHADFHEAAYHFAIRYYRYIADKCNAIKLSGMVKLNETLSDKWLNEHPETISRNNINQLELEKKAGIKLSSNGIFYPDSGFIHTRALSEYLLNHNNITVNLNFPVENIHQLEEGLWRTNISSQTFSNVIICCGSDSNNIAQTAWLPIKPLRGQTTNIMATSETSALKIAVCGKGYITPIASTSLSNSSTPLHCCGASFALNNFKKDISLQEQHENIEKAQSLFNHEPVFSAYGNNVGFRATIPDYMPIVGAVVEPEYFKTDYDYLSKDARKNVESIPKLYKGLYVLTGLGSHGLTYAPMASEIINAEINNTPYPLSDTLRQALSPSRFLLRGIIRNRL